MEDLKKIIDEVKRKVVTDKALETASTLASLLSILDEDSDDLCQVLMIMHHLAPKAPMPEPMYNMLARHGFKPDVKVLTEAEMIALAQTNECQCEECQELRAKGRELQTQVRQHIDNAHVKDTTLVTPGQNTVH